MKILVMLLTLALIFEGSLTTIPISLAILLALLLTTSNPLRQSISEARKLVFYLAFFSGMLLDLFNLRPIGLSSIYFLIFFFAVLLYERKFEIKSLSFVLISSFLGGLGFLVLTGVNNLLILQAVLSSVIAILVYKYYALRPKAQGMVNFTEP